MRSPQEWGAVYEEIESRYDRFASRLEELLRNLMEDDELDYVSTQWATLGVDDFIDRICINERAGIPVTDPFATRALHVAEVRVVTRNRTDDLRICELLERELEVDSELSMSSSLLAQAEAAVTEIPDLTARIEDRYEDAIRAGELDLELDMSSLAAYLSASEPVARLVAVARAAGMEEGPELSLADEIDLWVLHQCGCVTVRDLNDFVSEAQARAPDLLTQLCELAHDDDDELVLTARPEHVIVWLLLILRRADARLVSLLRFRRSIERALNVLIGNEVES